MEAKKYKVTVVTMYSEDRKNQHLPKVAQQVALCKKWVGKEITLAEAEANIEELEEIIFDGKTITIFNDYL